MIDPDRTQATSEKVSSKKLKTSVAQTALYHRAISCCTLGEFFRYYKDLVKTRSDVLFKNEIKPNPSPPILTYKALKDPFSCRYFIKHTHTLATNKNRGIFFSSQYGFQDLIL